jgi:exopolyphosphatase/guanosine-5'-triphosphate,3'-diphosphate pyrophosphatase
MKAATTVKKSKQALAQAPRPVGVTDIGSTFIRMTIAEGRGGGGFSILERVQQSVPIGREVVASRRISNATIEKCVSILRSYQSLLGEYGVPLENVRVIAAAAVREAENCDAFMDRLSVATGARIRVLDESEVGYYHHLALQPVLARDRKADRAAYCVMEVGGLTTDVFCLDRREIRFAQTYNNGSLRIRHQLQESGLPDKRMTDLAEGRAKEMELSLSQNVRDLDNLKLVLLGREMRFAASRILDGKKKGEGLAKVSVAALAKLVRDVIGLPIDELARRERLAYPDAETLGPALMIALRIAKALERQEIFIGGMSFCDGLVIEAVEGLVWDKLMSHHILRIAEETGLKYRYDAGHARYVARQSVRLFDLLQAEHRCAPLHRLILEVAAWLHDIGVFINTRGHHKHSMYIIQHTEFPGLNAGVINLISLVARYHRKAVPLQAHPDYLALSHEDRLVVCKLAALLRVADSFDRVHDQSLGDLRFDLQDEALTCIPAQTVDISAEQFALSEKGDLFEQIYGRKCVIRNP